MLKQKTNKVLRLLFVVCLLYGCAHNNHYIGEQYLGKKYISSPLGEEKAPDIDPLIRFDAFDCTTFVETALAQGDKNKLNSIRYKNGQIDFIYRNHFTETDWLQNNKDIVKNVSALYGKTSVRHVNIDKKNWFKKNHNIDTNFEKQSTDIEYIPYTNISKINTQKPLIILFIHDGDGFYDKIGTDLAVTHMGFLLPDGILRHASSQQGIVTDTNFEQYIANRKKNSHNLGIALVEIK